MAERRIVVGDVGLHVVDEGEGTPVLLLHGFPDSARLWRHQIEALTGAGFKAIAPDLRGYGRSDKPRGVSAYAMQRILEDLRAVLDEFGIERAHVVGHDWGAVAAWALAAFEPDRVRRLVVISVGHPRSFARPRPSQLARSWYAIVFQIPGLAERAFQANDWWLFRKVFGGSRDFDRYLDDLSRPGALTAALNWYRANGRTDRVLFGRSLSYPHVSVPTMGIWGSKDFALTEWQMKASEKYVDAEWRYERVEAGHWLPLSRREIINNLLLDFLGETA